MDHATFYDIFDAVAIKPNQFKRDLQKVFNILREGTTEPIIVEKILLNKIVKAHNDIERGRMDGEIVCLPFVIIDTTSSVTSSEDSFNSIECTISRMNYSASSYGNQTDNTRIDSDYTGNQSDSTSILSIDSRTISSDTIASAYKTTDTTITRGIYSHRTRSRGKNSSYRSISPQRHRSRSPQTHRIRSSQRHRSR